MNFRFTIGRRIGTGFGILVILNIIGFLLTQTTLNDSKRKTDLVTSVYSPSVRKLEKLNTFIIRSKMLISRWVTYQSEIDKRSDKQELIDLLDKEYPELKAEIQILSRNWSAEDVESLNAIFSLMDKLIRNYQDIMSSLRKFEDYDDPVTLLTARTMVEDEDGIPAVTRLIQQSLRDLIKVQQDNTDTVSTEMIASFDLLNLIVKTLGILLIVGGIIIAVGTVRSIVRPVTQLKRILISMGRGVLPSEKIEGRNDEIGEMSVALEGLVQGLSRTTVFANEVGAGNFSSEYKPLSDEDTLGLALLKMRTDLEENERVLEAKVIERTEEVVRQKEEIESQNQRLAVLYKHVTDSIRYAKRIQESILPPDALVKKLLPDSFILYKPKDIVSGDFYWVTERKGKALFAAVDCTGHGVPGAFMSIVGYNILKDVITHTNLSSPAEILDRLNIGVSETLHQHGYEDSAKDGMDISLCSLDYKTLELEYAGAYNPLYLIRKGQLIQYNANKFPLGFFVGDEKKNFTNNKIQLEKGDVIYIFSDGYADQFGGTNGKKFMASRFRDLLIEVSTLPPLQQKKKLDDTIEAWKGEHEQVDDICVIGVSV